MKRIFMHLIFATLLATIHPVATADDIDLFMGVPTTTTADKPNVIIVIDNAANFSSSTTFTCPIAGVVTALANTVGGIEQCALYKVFNDMVIPRDSSDVEEPPFNFAVMVYNANNIRDKNNTSPSPGNICGGSDGGCLMYPLTPLNSANRTEFLTWIKSWKTTGGAGSGYIKANSEATGAAMQEAWAYLKGRVGLSGRDYAGIAPSSSCANNYVIFIGNSYSSSGSPGDSTGNTGPKNALGGTNSTALKNASPAGDITPILTTYPASDLHCGSSSFTFPSSAHENKGFYMDEWSRYMNTQSITTYTIGILGASCQAEYEATLMSAAAVGGGKYFYTNDFTSLVIAFNTIASEIQSKNSVFAAVSLPVSVNTQGTYLNQVFVGMFRPDRDANPRWPGNLKQYKLGLVSGEVRLLDADGNSAISSSNSGFIAECARSYWTPGLSSPDNYWTNIGKANCTSYSAYSNTPDGNYVEKGAQGYKLRSLAPSSRNMKTCSTASCTALTDFNTSNTSVITKTLLGNSGMSDATQTDLINWQRGLNNKNDEFRPGDANMRPSVHGDVVHSRPVALNFGGDTTSTRKVVVFYGANDGVLRAVNGNRDGESSIGGISAGNEIWSFVPPEYYSLINRQRENLPTVSFPSTGANAKPYGVDGPITAYQALSGSTTTAAYVYATLRRGGRAVYAFDFTSMGDTTPNPTLKWKIGCPNQGNDTGCTGAPGHTADPFSGIGQTWSPPTITKASGYLSGNTPILLMGGGYDTCEDTDTGSSNNNCSSSSKGHYIYVIDGNSGELLKTFDTGENRGIIGGITVVPDSSTGMIRYAYAADLGGNIYRICGTSGSGNACSAIGATAPSNWTMKKIGSFGCSTPSSCNPNRKFMFAPDVVEDTASGLFYILAGTGDREKPLTTNVAATNVTNYFVMLKDSPSDATWLSAENSTCGANVMCLGSLYHIDSNATPADTDLAAKKGWYLDLRDNEQVVTSAITVSNVVTFSTHIPQVYDASSCSSGLGTASVYNINYKNAASARNNNLDGSRYETIAGGGLPPSPVAGKVILDDGSTVPFLIGGGTTSSLEGGSPTDTSSWTQPKSRVYWYIEQ
jgi:type IV pilus assembly protein PilY1